MPSDTSSTTFQLQYSFLRGLCVLGKGTPSLYQRADRPEMAGRARRKVPSKRKLRPSQVVKAARAIKNPLSSVSPAFPSLSDVPLMVTTSRGLQLSTSDADWMYKSVKDDLEALYAASTMKWNAAEKREELTHPDQQFVILSDEFGRLAFLSYRYDVEDGVPIMYIYEVYVESRARRKGLAVQLMRLAEQLASKTNMTKLVLTTFVANKAAMRLYREKLGYEIDESSPSNFVEEGGPAPTYEILSLCI